MVVITSSLSVFLLTVILCLSTEILTVKATSSNSVNEADSAALSSGGGNSANHPADNPLRSYLSRSGRLPNNVNTASAREAILSGNFDRFTPAPITDPNCHVDIEVIQRVPGRCIRTANGLPACQTEHWLSITSEECS